MSEMFDPTEMAEMAKRLEAIVANQGEGYEMIFFINKNDALELLDAYKLAVMGEPIAMARCWTEFGKIMERLEIAVNDDIETD
jgi:hypothetical protein